MNLTLLYLNLDWESEGFLNLTTQYVLPKFVGVKGSLVCDFFCSIYQGLGFNAWTAAILYAFKSF